jgi:hypothetical protein
MHRFGSLAGVSGDEVASYRKLDLLPALMLAWFEIMRLESARDGALGRGKLLYGPSLSTGGANPGVVFSGRGLIPPGFRQGRGTIDPTGANNGLVWECIDPGDSGDLTPMTREITYAAGLHLSYAPLHPGVTISLVPGIARSLMVNTAMLTAVQTFIAGVTTYAQLAADWAADYEATQLAIFTGDAGTLPAYFSGGVLYLSRAILVQYIPNGGATAVSWNATTRTVTVGIDIAGAGDSVAAIKAALAASATGAFYVVQVRNLYGSSGAGNVTVSGLANLIGGTGKAMRHGVLTMAQAGNKDLEFERVDFGDDALPVQVGLISDATAEPPVVEVVETGSDVLIKVRAKILTATALHIRQALRDSAEAMDWIRVRLADGSNGSGTPAAFALTALGAADDAAAVEFLAGTVPATGVIALTDDAITVNLPALGGTHPAASSLVVQARIGGVLHQMNAVVVA